MALITGKLVIPNGAATGGNQPMQSEGWPNYVINNPTTDTKVLEADRIGTYRNGSDIRFRLGDGSTQVKDLADFIAPRTIDVEDAATGAYTILAADNGKYKRIDAGLTIPTGLSVGFNCKIYLDNATKQTLTTTGLTVNGKDANASITAYGTIEFIVVATDEIDIVGDMEA